MEASTRNKKKRQTVCEEFCFEFEFWYDHSLRKRRITRENVKEKKYIKINCRQIKLLYVSYITNYHCNLNHLKL